MNRVRLKKKGKETFSLLLYRIGTRERVSPARLSAMHRAEPANARTLETGYVAGRSMP